MHAENSLLTARQVCELLRLSGRDGERLVHHHVLTGQKRGAGQIEMGGVGCGNYYELDFRSLEKRCSVLYNSGLWIPLPRGFAMPLHHRREAQPGNCGDDRRMKYLAGHSIADEADVDLSGHLPLLANRPRICPNQGSCAGKHSTSWQGGTRESRLGLTSRIQKSIFLV